MTNSYTKISISQIEQHFYLYYINKYHDLITHKLEKSKIITNYDSIYSKDFIKRRYRAQLLNNLINSNQVKNMQHEYNLYLKTKK